MGYLGRPTITMVCFNFQVNFGHFLNFSKKKLNIFITKFTRYFGKDPISDHTSPFAGFWSPKSGPLRRWKHMASIFLSISTIPLLTKVACFLLVYPYFSTRGVILSLPLCALMKYAFPPLTKRYFFLSYRR
jgi:hypothetical protein